MAASLSDVVPGLDATTPSALGNNVNVGATEVVCALVLFGIGLRALGGEESGMGIDTLTSIKTTLLVGVCAGAGVHGSGMGGGSTLGLGRTRGRSVGLRDAIC
jgi:hypothetical protein